MSTWVATHATVPLQSPAIVVAGGVVGVVGFVFEPVVVAFVRRASIVASVVASLRCRCTISVLAPKRSSITRE